MASTLSFEISLEASIQERLGKDEDSRSYQGEGNRNAAAFIEKTDQ